MTEIEELKVKIDSLEKEANWLAKKLRIAYACQILGTKCPDITKDIMKAMVDEKGIPYLRELAKKETS